MADDNIIRVPFLPVGAPVGHAITRLAPTEAWGQRLLEGPSSTAVSERILVECECGWRGHRDTVRRARMAHTKHCDLERAGVRARAGQ